MYKIACTRKEASCIIGNLFGELVPICEKCRGLSEDSVTLKTESGLLMEGATTLVIEGKSSVSGRDTKIKLTDYGFEFYGDIAEVTRIREKRCAYIGRAVSSPKED